MPTLTKEIVWLGCAVLSLAETNPQRAKGNIGAYAGFACRGQNIHEALKALYLEFEESGYLVMGLENMNALDMMDRPLTEHESHLVEALSSYPVQFKNVHLHKGDA